MRMDNTNDMVSVDGAREAVRGMSRRVGLLHMCYARTLVDELGEEKGKELIRKALWDYGTRIGKRARERVEAMGLESTPENFGKGSDLSPTGFDNEKVVVDGEPRTRSFGCAFAEVWQEYGEEELGSLYCLVDPSKMQGYNSNWTMVHTKKLPDGDEYCETAVRPVSSEGENQNRIGDACPQTREVWNQRYRSNQHARPAVRK